MLSVISPIVIVAVILLLGYYQCTYIVSTTLLLFQLEPLVNGPFTPDLANPISQLGKNAQEKGWPMDIKVGTLKKKSSLATVVHVVHTCTCMYMCVHVVISISAPANAGQ